MSGPDAMHSEMPGSFPGRPGGEPDEPLLDMIIGRRLLPPGAPPEIHDLARMLAAAAGPAEPGELDGQAAALTAFRQHAFRPGISPAALRPARRWLSGRPARGRLPIAAVLVAAAAGLGSTAVAAYAGVLPGPIQHLAHAMAGAPDSPHTTPPLKHPFDSPSGGDHHKRGASAPHKTPAMTPAPDHGFHGVRSRRHGSRQFIPGPINATCVPRTYPTQVSSRPEPTQGPPGQGDGPFAWPSPSSAPRPSCTAVTPRTTGSPPGL